MSLVPLPEAVYPDPATGFAAIQAHAKAHGYALFRRTSNTTKVIYTCDRAGKYDPRGKDPNIHGSKQRKGTGSKKCGCLMRVELRQDNVLSSWMVKVLEPIHNHGPSVSNTAHTAHRVAALAPDIHALISTLSSAGLSPGQVLTVLRQSNPDIALTPKDIGNLTQKDRRDELNGRTPIQWLLEARSFSI